MLGLEGGTVELEVDEELVCRGMMGLAREMAANASAAWKMVRCIVELFVQSK